MARAVMFFGFEMFHVIFGNNVPKTHKNWWCSHGIAKKNGDHNPPYCNISRTNAYIVVKFDGSSGQLVWHISLKIRYE